MGRNDFIGLILKAARPDSIEKMANKATDSPCNQLNFGDVMLLFPTLRMLDESITAKRCKIHLASLNDIGEKPLDVFFDGEFDAWQSRQSKKNFQRDFVISLIQTPIADRWLFAGVHNSLGCVPAFGAPWASETTPWFQYKTQRRSKTERLSGRLIVSFERPGRMPYLLGENWEDSLEIAAYRIEPYSAHEFSGSGESLLVA